MLAFFGMIIFSIWLLKPAFGFHAYSPIGALYWVPLAFLFSLDSFFSLFAFVLFFPYIYLTGCLIVWLIGFVRQNLKVGIVLVFALFFLFGLDEPLVNNTVNKPVYSCNMDSDCVSKSVSLGVCGDWRCVNSDWSYYNSQISSVFSSSCVLPRFYCICNQNTCEEVDYTRATDEPICNRAGESQRDNCLRTVEYNKLKEREANY